MDDYNDISNKIPSIDSPQYYSEFEFIDSELVELNNNEDGILVEMQYPILHMENAINKCYMRKEVKKRLLEAKKNLPEGYTFKIWDAYRTFELQEELYYKYYDLIIKEFDLYEMSEDEKKKIINQFVSLPIKDVELAPAHTTGGAIDLTLVKDGKEVDMGCEFDEFTNRTYTDFYEKNESNLDARVNRRILYNAMVRAGFTNLPSECWHFDYGDKIWAFYKKNKIKYKGIF